MHRDAGEVLERSLQEKRPGIAAELAWHFLAGGDRARALRYSLLAGDQAEEVFAHGEAMRHTVPRLTRHA
ncbi:MAG: hypothetical protein ACR2JC_20600 [Chloroflexota bacterium]|nr:MAG: hypothetical protein DLM70_10470 [Chloroflexota bacterium]